MDQTRAGARNEPPEASKRRSIPPIINHQSSIINQRSAYLPSPQKNLASSRETWRLREKSEDYETPFDRRPQWSQSLSFDETLLSASFCYILFCLGHRSRWSLGDLRGSNPQPSTISPHRPGQNRTIPTPKNR